MIETSKDILYLVIAFCVLWITVFLCWMFYYVTRILKNANEIAEEFRSRLQVLTEAIHYLRGKVENIHSLLNVAGGGMAGLVRSKANDWINKGSNKMNSAAKDAVAKAVEATANKMKKTAKKLKK